ncbi:MAG: hypothetical protein R3Y11_10970 [Pseudomonadota bacterium]
MQYKIRSLSFELLFAFFVGSMVKFLGLYFYWINEELSSLILISGIPLIFYCTSHRWISYLFLSASFAVYMTWAGPLGISDFVYSEASFANPVGRYMLFRCFIAYLATAVVIHVFLTGIHILIKLIQEYRKKAI